MRAENRFPAQSVISKLESKPFEKAFLERNLNEFFSSASHQEDLETDLREFFHLRLITCCLTSTGDQPLKSATRISCNVTC